MSYAGQDQWHAAMQGAKTQEDREAEEEERKKEEEKRKQDDNDSADAVEKEIKCKLSHSVKVMRKVLNRSSIPEKGNDRRYFVHWCWRGQVIRTTRSGVGRQNEKIQVLQFCHQNRSRERLDEKGASRLKLQLNRST